MDAHASAELGALLFTEAPEALLLLDPGAGRVCAANPAAERLFARPRGVLCGMLRRDLLTADHGDVRLDAAAPDEQDAFLLTEGEAPVRLPVRLRLRRLARQP